MNVNVVKRTSRNLMRYHRRFKEYNVSNLSGMMKKDLKRKQLKLSEKEIIL